MNKQFMVGDRRYTIMLDIMLDYDSSCSPRNNYNLGTLVLDHRRYRLVHEADVEPHDILKDDSYYSLPVWGYDHSGLSMKASHERKYPFNDQFDSGLLGVVYVDKEKAEKELNRRPEETPTDFTLRVYEALKEEVELYNLYIQGEVYAYTVERRVKTTREDGMPGPDDWDVIDSCGGYCGIEALLYELPEDAQDAYKRGV